MSEQSQGTWLTQEAYDRLSAELEHRKTTERKEIAQRVEAARQEGDLRENAGYHAAREEAGLNEARIIQLEETLENAQIGEAADDGSVSAGTIVTAKVAGKEQVFALGGQEITADVPDGRHAVERAMCPTDFLTTASDTDQAGQRGFTPLGPPSQTLNISRPFVKYPVSPQTTA